MVAPLKKNSYSGVTFGNHKGRRHFGNSEKFCAIQNFGWNGKFQALCTDGAPAMLGNISGLLLL
jgi:hypothetical protein